MAAAGEVVENPRTGERITFRSLSPDLLVMQSEWTRGGHRAAAHVHPGMEERWELLAGRAAFRIGDDPELRLSAGESATAPPGAPHLAWNPDDEPVRLRIEMRPALRWAELVERLFTLARDGRGGDRAALAALLADFPRELAPAPPRWPAD